MSKMKLRIRILVLLVLMGVFSYNSYSQSTSYVCPPCGCSNDGKKFDKPGSCPSCSMTLLNESNKSEGLNYTNLEPDEVCDKVAATPGILFLDVRTKREFDLSPLGRIKDAKHIHVSDVASRIEELEGYKDKEIIVYCLIGIRSARASSYLADNGFTKVNNMLGGMELWNELSSDAVKCKTTLLEKN